MKKKLPLLILSFIILPCVAFFAACTGDKNSNRQTPIYQGMVVTSADETNTVSYGYTAQTMSHNDDDDDDDDWFDFDDDDWHWHGSFRPGEHHGDSEDKDEDIDQQKPYPNEPSIDEKISTLEVVGPAKEMYYTQKNTDVFVVIKLYNPDQFEIVSLVFNGVKYTNYMFAPGSDLENIKIKVSIKDVTGIVSYTVDEIKYIDGTTIKDVIVNADKTVKIGIKDGEMVQALVSEQKANLSSFDMNVQVSDDYKLLENSNGKLKAYLYDGYKILDQKELVIDRQHVKFEDLTPNTLYQVAIAGIYDDLSGDGVALHVLYEYAFYTESFVSFTTPTITQTSIEWNYVWNNEVQNKTFESVELYLDNSKEQTLDKSATKVENLYSDRVYTIKATYKNLKGENESIYLHAMTQKKDLPTYVINDLAATKTDVQFTISKTDVDNVATINKIRLLKDGHEEKSITENFDGTLSFNGLLSNTDYVIELEYTYNLNDGKGSTTLPVTKGFKTEAMIAPTFEIDEPNASQTDVQFAYTKNDPDSLAQITKITLMLDATTVQTINDNFYNNHKFEGLLSGKEYKIVLEYTYNLNDGSGQKEGVIEKFFHTTPKTVPTFTLSLKNRGTTMLEFEYEKTDPDGLFQFVRAELSGKDATYPASSLDNLKFENLTSYTDYTLTVKYSYDLNDGNGTQYAEKTLTAKTEFELEIVSTSVDNNTVISEGDTFYLTIMLNNPAKARITSAKVNGIEYGVSWSELRPYEATITILYDDQFEGGETELVVSSLTAEIDGMTKEISLNENNTGSVFINGSLEVLDAEFRDLEGNPLEDVYLIDGQEYYIYIHLYNPTGYQVTSVKMMSQNMVTIVIDEIESIDEECIRFKVTPYVYDNRFFTITINIEEIAYIGTHLNTVKTIAPDFKNNVVYVGVEQEEITYISNADQLKQMSGGGIYFLNNDINLEGKPWTPGDFYGLFDGQGFSIKNFLVSGTFETDVDFGLFSSAKGLIRNLNIENFRFQITNKNPDYQSRLYMGAISGRQDNDLYIEKCTFDISAILIGNIFPSFASPYTTLVNCIIKCTLASDLCFPFNETIENCELHLYDGNDNYNWSSGEAQYQYFRNCAVYRYSVYPYSESSFKNGFVFNNQTKETIYFAYPDSNIEGSTITEKVAKAKELWDHDVWDFDHLDEYGNPTLKNLPKQKTA